ncbi:MAG: 3-deoxy-manno-octulosonate cytidylyltransferase (CMP-KDO synthetase) [Crocinitomicaceae bacterium]|jgi:3-deoxy-manno-octulosonate cytidylyltransferase (CMP-KDO synthetase)
MKIVGIIPARYESSRFPGKPLIDLKGKTMIQRVYEGAKKSAKLTRVIVATDDQRIFDEVTRFGGEVSMTSDSHRTGTDRCGEIAEQIEADVIVNIQGDEPLIDYRQLDALCESFSDQNVGIATLGIKEVSDNDKSNPNRIKVVLDHQNDALYFSRSPIPNQHNGSDQAIKAYEFHRHIGVYAYRKNTLRELVNLQPTTLEKVESLEQLRWMFYGYKVRVVETTIETPNIDVPEDVAIVLTLL